MQINEIQSKLDFIISELERLQPEIEKTEFSYDLVFKTKGKLISIRNKSQKLYDLIYEKLEPDDDQEIAEIPF